MGKNNNRYIKTSRVTINIGKTKYINSTISKNNISNNPISYLNDTIINKYLQFDCTYSQKTSNNYCFIVARICIILCILSIVKNSAHNLHFYSYYNMHVKLYRVAHLVLQLLCGSMLFLVLVCVLVAIRCIVFIQSTIILDCSDT